MVMIVWKLDLQLPMQSVPITTEVVSWLVMFNVQQYYISAISWRSVL
jgi:hypothetical protein